MTVSMRVMSAGEGYRYLLKSVAVADGNRDLSSPLADYYTEQGTPPGVWLGTGITDLGDGQLRPWGVVGEEQLRLLLGQGRDPLTGEALGRAYPTYPSRADRVRARVDALDPELGELARASAVEAVKVEEADRRTRHAVAGFDYTFSVPKSVSVLWALADPHTQAAVLAAHHAAIADVIGLMEREVAATRTGTSATDGSVAQVDVAGLIATAYDHYDSRSGDPQLHTHVVISNKVKTVGDGKWRSLDSRPMHAATVAMSEHYNAVLADHLTRRLGVTWEQRARGRDRNPAWEIAGIPQELIEVFSSRSAEIGVKKDRLIVGYLDRHGHQPSARTVIKLRQQATLETRPDKTVQSLADLTAQWQRAAAVVGVDHTGWADRLVRPDLTGSAITVTDVPAAIVERIGRQVVGVVGERRSTWRRWNLHAEASRQTIGLRFATTHDRETVLEQIADVAEATSLRLTPPDLAAVPAAFTRADGRATALTRSALANHEPWTRAFGRPPPDPSARNSWAQHVRTIAAYRDRYQITTDNIIGATPATDSPQELDATRAQAATAHARRLSTVGFPPAPAVGGPGLSWTPVHSR